MNLIIWFAKLTTRPITTLDAINGERANYIFLSPANFGFDVRRSFANELSVARMQGGHNSYPGKRDVLRISLARLALDFNQA